MVDINADGMLDVIYVCKSGTFGGGFDRKCCCQSSVNENSIPLLQEEGGKVQPGAICDYRRHFLITIKMATSMCSFSNYSLKPYRSRPNVQPNLEIRAVGDRLYRNDDAHFTNVSEQAGI